MVVTPRRNIIVAATAQADTPHLGDGADFFWVPLRGRSPWKSDVCATIGGGRAGSPGPQPRATLSPRGLIDRARQQSGLGRTRRASGMKGERERASCSAAPTDRPGARPARTALAPNGIAAGGRSPCGAADASGRAAPGSRRPALRTALAEQPLQHWQGRTKWLQRSMRSPESEFENGSRQPPFAWPARPSSAVLRKPSPLCRGSRVGDGAAGARHGSPALSSPLAPNRAGEIAKRKPDHRNGEPGADQASRRYPGPSL